MKTATINPDPASLLVLANDLCQRAQEHQENMRKVATGEAQTVHHEVQKLAAVFAPVVGAATKERLERVETIAARVAFNTALHRTNEAIRIARGAEKLRASVQALLVEMLENGAQGVADVPESGAGVAAGRKGCLGFVDRLQAVCQHLRQALQQLGIPVGHGEHPAPPAAKPSTPNPEAAR